MKKSRKNKLILIGILAIIYIIIAVNFHKIRFALSLLRLYGKEKKIESSIEDDTNIENNIPVVDNPIKNILNSVDNVDKPENTEDGTNGTVDKVDTVNEEKKEITNKDTKKSYISIINEYNIIFEDLKSTFESELNALIKESIKEYSKGETSNSKLANKYLSIGSDLEKSSDEKFNKILKEMEKELKNNGHDTSIVKDIKEYYTSFKNAKKMDLIARGMKRVK
ncbi:hypothetical protein [Tissierella praeacuta]|uniref:hypothetical protein n=1 Tax=Tissierella praeacuta TaxID=43131 RepID=UPI00334097E1